MPVLDASVAVDRKIASAPEFARPIMEHLRVLVHRAAPNAEETVKWGRPFFTFHGKPLCYIAAFGQHCTVGFWGAKMVEVLREAGMPVDEAGGGLGRIRSLADLPPDTKLLAWIRLAAEDIVTSGGAPPRRRSPRPALETPGDLGAALAQQGSAAEIFAGMSPSCRREYIEWIEEAKRPETRSRRISSAVSSIAEGKPRS